jgi:hypothetical protein
MDNLEVLATFMVAVGVALAFQRQRKKHRIELSEAYGDAGLELPPPMPMIGKDEAWISIAIGILLCLGGIGFTYLAVVMWHVTGKSSGIVLPTLFLGAGGALILSAAMALRLRKRRK